MVHKVPENYSMCLGGLLPILVRLTFFGVKSWFNDVMISWMIGPKRLGGMYYNR